MIFAAEKSTFYRCWNGQQAQQDPKPQRCPQGDGQGSSKAQMCDGGDLTGQNGGHRMIPAKAAGEKKHQHSGEDAVEELPEEVCAGGESTFSDKREYLTVNGQTGPAQNKGGHTQPIAQRCGHIPEAPDTGGHLDGPGKQAFGHVLMQAQSSQQEHQNGGQPCDDAGEKQQINAGPELLQKLMSRSASSRLHWPDS